MDERKGEGEPMRLIDADELSKWISGQSKSPSCPKDESSFGLRIMKYIDRMPSVQPDIIACWDCKHYIPHDKRCGYWNHGVQPLMWCSQAERRTDERMDI